MGSSLITVTEGTPVETTVNYEEILVNTFFYGDVLTTTGRPVWVGNALLLKTQDNITNISNGGGVARKEHVKEICNYRPVNVEIIVTSQVRKL